VKKITELRPAIAAFLLMMAMALTTSGVSFFVTPVCDALGFGRGSFTVYYSVMVATGAVGSMLLGQYMNRIGVRRIALVSGLWVCAGLVMFSLSGALWHFYLVAAFIGLFASSCVNVCASVIVQRAYTGARAASILGVVMSGSGVGGVVVSLIIPRAIEAFGWQMGYRLLGLLWLALVWTAAAVLGRGADAAAAARQQSCTDGMSRAEALRSPVFYLLYLVLALLNACAGVQQQIPSMLAGMDFDTAAVSLLASMITGCLAVGKVIQGRLYSRLGSVKGGIIAMAVFAAGFLMLTDRRVVVPGLVVMALGMGVVTTLCPLLTRLAFGDREYAAIWSIMATASSAGAFFINPAWGMVYDVTGSYKPALLTAPVVLAVSVLVVTVAFRGKKAEE